MVQDPANPSQRSTKLLLGEPASVDAFGAHDEIAQAMANLINEEKRGVGMALCGSFGSGKSTVIQLLTQKLSANVKILVFDAWAHSSDSLRRAFIERLVLTLSQPISWINVENWKKRLEDLHGRRKQEVKKTIPYLTPWGFLGVFLLSLVPVGTNLRQLLSEEYQYIAYLMVMAPMLYAACLFVLNFIAVQSGVNGSKVTIWTRFTEAARLAATLLTNQSITESVTDTISEPDPTTIEFEKQYISLVGEALASASNRKLVIVIDNLDRLNSDESRLIWATLGIFTKNNLNESSEFQRVWVIVPLDPNDSNKDQSERYPRELLSKTFQLALTVPKPFLSKWKSYFDQRLSESMPTLSEIQRHRVYRVFASVLTGNSAPTPREITVFINQLALLFELRGNEISIEVMAYFVCQTVNKALPVSNFDDPTKVFPSGIRDILPSSANYELAALIFGSALSEAPEAIFSSRIEPYLQGAGVNLDEFGNTEAFWLAFEQCLADALKATAIDTPIYRAFKLIQARAGNSLPAPAVTAKDSLIAAVIKKDQWLGLDVDTVASLVYAGDMSESSDVLDKVIKSIYASMPEAEFPYSESSPITQYSSVLRVLINHAEQVPAWKEAIERHLIDGPVLRYFVLLLNLKKLGCKALELSLIRTNILQEEVDDVIAAFLNNLDEAALPAFLGDLSEIGVGFDKVAAATICAAKLRDQKDKLSKLFLCWHCLDALEHLEDSISNSIVQPLVDDGYALRNYVELLEQGMHYEAGLILFQILWWKADQSQYISAQGTSVSVDIYAALLDDSVENDQVLLSMLEFVFGWDASDLNKIIECVIEGGLSRQILSKIIRLVISRDHLLTGVSNDFFVENRGFADYLDSETFDLILQSLFRRHLAISLLEKGVSENSEPIIRRGYEIALEAGDKEVQDSLTLMIKEYFAKLTVEDWRENIEVGGIAINLLSSAKSSEFSFGLEGSVTVAISDIAKDATEKVLISSEIEHINLISRFLAESSTEIIGRNIVEAITADISLEYLGVFSQFVVEDVILDEADKLVRNIFMQAISKDDARLQDVSTWLLSRCPGILKKAKPSSIKELNALLDSSDELDSEANNEFIANVREALKRRK